MRTILLLLAIAFPLAAEIGPRSEEERKATAHVIATGTVQAVYSRTRALADPAYENTLYVIEVAVGRVEKGEGVGALVYARGWQISKRPENWVGGSGHYFPGAAGKSRGTDLAQGDRVRLFLVRAQDGGLDLVLPNGLDLLPAVDGPK